MAHLTRELLRERVCKMSGNSPALYDKLHAEEIEETTVLAKACFPNLPADVYYVDEDGLGVASIPCSEMEKYKETRNINDLPQPILPIQFGLHSEEELRAAVINSADRLVEHIDQSLAEEAAGELAGPGMYPNVSPNLEQVEITYINTALQHPYCARELDDAVYKSLMDEDYTEIIHVSKCSEEAKCILAAVRANEVARVKSAAKPRSIVVTAPSREAARLMAWFSDLAEHSPEKAAAVQKRFAATGNTSALFIAKKGLEARSKERDQLAALRLAALDEELRRELLKKKTREEFRKLIKAQSCRIEETLTILSGISDGLSRLQASAYISPIAATGSDGHRKYLSANWNRLMHAIVGNIFPLFFLMLISGCVGTHLTPDAEQDLRGVIVAYNCSTPSATLATVDATRVDECPSFEESDYLESSHEVEILQRLSFQEVEVISCHRKVLLRVGACKRYWRFPLQPDSVTFPPMTKKECELAHLTNKYHAGPVSADLTLGFPRAVSFFSAGKLDEGGSCETASYVGSDGITRDRIVEEIHTVTIRRHTAKYRFDEGTITTSSGAEFSARTDDNVSPQLGRLVVSAPLPEKCSLERYTLLFRGKVTKLKSSQSAHEYLILRSESQSFALVLAGQHFHCSLALTGTTSPDIFVSMGTRLQGLATLPGGGLNTFTHQHSKLLLTEINLREDVKTAIAKLSRNQCEQARSLLTLKLTVATVLRRVPGSYLGFKEGTLGIITGETLTVIECVAMSVRPRATEKCYQYLPVTTKYGIGFLDPLTRSVSSFSPEVECSALIYPSFKVGNSWLTIKPIRPTPVPQLLKPDSIDAIRFDSIANILPTSVYELSQLEAYTRYIQSPLVQERAVDTITAKMSDNGRITYNDFSTDSLMNENFLEAYMNKRFGLFVKWMIQFGSWVSAVIGLVVIAQILVISAKILFSACGLRRAGRPILEVLRFILAGVWDAFVSTILSKINTRAAPLRKKNVPPPPPSPPSAPTPGPSTDSLALTVIPSSSVGKTRSLYPSLTAARAQSYLGGSQSSEDIALRMAP